MKKITFVIPRILLLLASVLGGYAGVSIVTSTEAQDPGKSQVVVPRPTLTPQEKERFFQPGDPWDGKGVDLTEAEASAFADYPLYWFGPSFRGFNLQTIQHVKYTAPEGATPATMDRFTFIYGRCTPDEGQNRCAPPAYIHVQPACAVKPEVVMEQARSSPLRTLNDGALLQHFFDGHVMIWTGNVSIDIGVVSMER
jgi:hypothetical protein